MIIIKNGKAIYKNKKPLSIDDKKRCVFIEFLACLKFGNKSKKSIKNILKDFNNIKTFDEIVNSNFLSEKNINGLDVFDKIHTLIKSGDDLKKIKYFYNNDYDESYDKSLVDFLKIHCDTESYFRDILKYNYSSFSSSLNEYIDYQKQR